MLAILPVDIDGAALSKAAVAKTAQRQRNSNDNTSRV
jgi:hypothetical protein